MRGQIGRIRMGEKFISIHVNMDFILYEHCKYGTMLILGKDLRYVLKIFNYNEFKSE